MTKDPLNELIDFLKPETRLDLRQLSLDHVMGLSGGEEGIHTLLQNENLIKCLIDLIDDPCLSVAKKSMLILINITANDIGAAEILKIRPYRSRNILELCVTLIMDAQKTDADCLCMIMSNITRIEDQLETCITILMPHLSDILNIFVNTNFNKTGSNLNYLSPLFSNLSRSPRIRKWLIEENPFVPLIKLLPFTNHSSPIRRGGVFGTIRNLSFDVNNHEVLLNPNLDLLTYLLNPLMGNEDYIDEEMDLFPISLQYQSMEKERETDCDIRKIILETLNKLCSKRNCRETLRKNGTYYILREYHKWEKSAELKLACENVVDILIQKECEVGTDDLSSVVVPEDMTEKFIKMDKDYLKT